MRNLNKFDVIEDSSITVGKHVLGRHWPHNSKSTIGALNSANNSTSTVETVELGPMLDQCQHANNDVLPTTPTIIQL